MAGGGAANHKDGVGLLVGTHPVDPVPLVPLKRQSPEEDTEVGVGWGLARQLLEGCLMLFH